MNQSRGIVRTIMLVIIALIILGYFGLNVRNIINSPTVKDNLIYAADSAVYIWNTYLKDPVTFIWHILAGRLEQLWGIFLHVRGQQG